MQWKEQKNLIDKIKEISFEDDFVKYLGFVPYEKLPSIYCSSDIFLFASSCENMPNIVLEGMASGLPIACSNRGPMPEMLGNGGVYFDPEKEESICSAIRKLVLSPELRKNKADIAFNLSKQYSWKKCANDTFKYFSTIINEMY